MPSSPTRLSVNKTYKLYINGAFPRTESGRAMAVTGKDGRILAQACRASRKDLRNAVVGARKASPGWAGRSAYNRSQILYRLAEMLEGRSDQLVRELKDAGATPAQADKEVALSIDRLVYYAGWCDKLHPVFGTVNPVSHPHFCFSVPEPTGVVAIAAPDSAPLLGLISLLAPALCGGNVVIALVSEPAPLPALTFAEIVHTSDVPAGVVNLLSGLSDELLPQMASHRDINAMVLARASAKAADLEIAAVDNLKRWVSVDPATRWTRDDEAHPYRVTELMETKTTWHPVGL